MRFGRVTLSRIYAIFWALLLSIFVVRAAPEFWNNLRREKIARPAPDASMDRFLAALLQIPNPTARLNQTFSRLPAPAPLLFVSAKNDDRWDFVYSAVCYLAWPRKIDRVELAPAERFDRDVSNQTAVVFCGTMPAISDRPRQTIGPNLIVQSPVAIQ